MDNKVDISRECEKIQLKLKNPKIDNETRMELKRQLRELKQEIGG